MFQWIKAYILPLISLSICVIVRTESVDLNKALNMNKRFYLILKGRIKVFTCTNLWIGETITHHPFHGKKKILGDLLLQKRRWIKSAMTALEIWSQNCRGYFFLMWKQGSLCRGKKKKKKGNLRQSQSCCYPPGGSQAATNSKVYFGFSEGLIHWSMRGINFVRTQISLIWWNWRTRETCFLVQARIWAVWYRSFSGYIPGSLEKGLTLFFLMLNEWEEVIDFVMWSHCPIQMSQQQSIWSSIWRQRDK